jgi:hypothetical protein
MANLKRSFITLIDLDAQGEILETPLLTPKFLPARVVREAMELSILIDEIDEETGENKHNQVDILDMMLDFVANKIYKDSGITVDDLLDRVHAPDLVNQLQEQVAFVASGQQSDETKKFLASKKK